MMTTKSSDDPMQAVAKPDNYLDSSEMEPSNLDKNLNTSERVAWFAVWVAALGYFVDVFDMYLFSNFRVKSLTSLGLTPEQVTLVGVKLFNWQQAGFLIGGILWGVLGDKRGRAKVMFGSILIYSVANLLNAFVTNVEQYQILRFLTGLGLAGEIGAGITLVVELLPKMKRGIGTTIVTCLGVSGAILAAMAGRYLDWRTAYIVGGVMGLSLLLLRFMVHESGAFSKMHKEDANVPKGSLILLFKKPERVLRFLSCISLGIPLYITFGLLVAFAPEIALGLGIVQPITASDALLYAASGLTLGDLMAGLLSQKLKSRKRPLIYFLCSGLAINIALLSGIAKTPFDYQIILGILGFSTGYWACFLTTCAENFGTNLRATVTTSIPNLVRGSAIILTSSFVYLKGSYPVAESLFYIVVVTYILAAMGLAFLKETFHEDMDYYEK
jgi:putative MFS transporter